MRLKKPIFTLSSISVALFLAACGGGSSDSTTSTTTTLSTTSSITGTVPGTLIEAFCADGSYYSVTSTDNGTTQHPFTITIPNNVDCRLVMTTNENDPVNRVITPIELNANGVASVLISLSGDLELGYVPLALNTANVDINSDGVEDQALQVTVTSSTVVARVVTYDPLDSDLDGIPNIYEDDDNDSVSNHYDDDYLASRSADDRDGDGVNDIYDRDDDNDSIRDEDDDDDDSDGIKDLDDSDHDDDHETTTTTNTTYTPVQNYTATTGRLLVSQCAQCHGTNGRSVTSWDSITDEANELASEMFEEGGIMLAQAHGYTTTEIQAMASWLASQPYSSNDDDHDDD